MSNSKPAQLTPLGAALAGALGGCFSNAVVYPLDVAKTRVQASSNGGRYKKLSLTSVLIQIMKEEGISGLYKGFGATMLNTFSTQYAYFFFYSFVRTSYTRRLASKLPAGSRPPPLSTAAELLLGAIAGALAQIFTIPVSVIATRQQIGHSADRSRKKASERPTDIQKDVESAEKDKDAKDDSFMAVTKEIIEEEGVTGLWLGLKPSLVLTVNPAITYGVYERVKSLLLLAQERATGKGAMSNGKLSPWMSFAIGALSKTLATIVTYPYIMAKVRIQARTADDGEDGSHLPHHVPHHEHSKHVGALDILARVWRKQGLLGWYQGMSAQITKAVLCQALLFLSKEQFEHWALAIMLLSHRLRQSQA